MKLHSAPKQKRKQQKGHKDTVGYKADLGNRERRQKQANKHSEKKRSMRGIRLAQDVQLGSVSCLRIDLRPLATQW